MADIIDIFPSFYSHLQSFVFAWRGFSGDVAFLTDIGCVTLLFVVLDH